MIYFTSDTHFGHFNIIKYCNRPFDNVNHMNETIINNINSVVQPNDTLYHLGDYAFGTKNKKFFAKDTKHYLEQINCKNVYLIRGNHDKNIDIMKQLPFKDVYEYLKISIDAIPVAMFHYPMFPGSWENSFYGSFQLFGHVHGNLNKENREEFRHIPDWSLQMDVGVDSNNFYPWSWEAIKEYMKPKVEAFFDRRKKRRTESDND